MISFQEARSIILSKAHSFGVETVDLEDALGRVLAQDIYAPRDFPPFNRSAMDGIAINFRDLENGIRDFKSVETIFAGNNYQNNLNIGDCYKIMTGAAVPDDANVVIKIEDVEVKETHLHVLIDDFQIHQNIAKRGQDLEKNEIALKKGTFINAATTGLLASLGKAIIKVEQLPRVNIITTGNEVLDLDQQISPEHIYNSNSYVLKAFLKQNKIETKNCVHLQDDIVTLEESIKELLNTDILVITGGVSAGEADYIPQVLENLGLKKLFHKVAIKPGKPIWCGHTEKGALVFAVPGNPFSCLVTFKLFAEFYIKACLGFDAMQMQQLPINYDRNKKSSLDEFFPVEIKDGLIHKIDINGSGDIRLGFAANALAMQMVTQKEIKKGTLVPYILC
jgi:molybdopterin molybdotransferase